MTEHQLAPSDQAIIDKNEQAFAPIYEARAALEAEEAIATSELDQANKDLELAQENVSSALKKLSDLQSEDGATYDAIEDKAKSLAIEMVADPSLDPLSKTLYSLVYSDKSISSQSSKDSYGSAAYKARQAIDTILENAQPGAPIIGISRDYGGYTSDDYVNVRAGIANSKTLTVTIPKHKMGGYSRLEGGAIELVLPKAVNATSKDHGLASLDAPTEHRIELIKNHWEYDYERLERLAKNDGQVIIGTEAISKRLETMNQGHRVAAMLALHAIGVVISVPEETTEKLQATLVVAVAELANRREPSEYEYKHAIISDITSRGRRNNIVHDIKRNKHDSILVVAQSLNTHSLRGLLTTAELDKNSLTDRVVKTLESSKKDDRTNLEELAQNARTLATLSGFIDALYMEDTKTTTQPKAS